MVNKKQTPLTVEAFFEEVMPAIEELIDKKIDGAKNELTGEIQEVKGAIQGVKGELKEVKDDVLDYKVETIGEIKALREQVTTTLYQYERTDKRLTRVEKNLNSLHWTFK